MQIIFNTCIDNGYYLDYSLAENKNIFNRRYVGPAGLLGLLERELGLSGDYPSNRIRKIKYKVYLSQFLEKYPGAFFAESFAMDPAGVAAELLKYRDQLILAGWDQEIKGISDKIDTLAEIESQFGIPFGREDRWRQICRQLGTITTADFSIEKISVEENINDLHPFYKHLFELIGNTGTVIEERVEPETGSVRSNLDRLKKWTEQKPCENNKIDLAPDDKKSFQMLYFPNELEASEFIAAQSAEGVFKDNTVIINRNNHMFDLIQQTFGNPASGSVIRDARSQLLQLIPLSLSLFIQPLTIYNLISYLQISVHPLPGKLRGTLLNIIGDNGGIPRDKWEEAITAYKNANEKTADEKIIFATLHQEEPEKINCQVLIRFYISLSAWANKRKQQITTQDETDRSYNDLACAELNELRLACNAIAGTLKLSASPTIRKKELETILQEVTEEQELSIIKPQRNSVPVYSSPGQIISKTDNLIWLDFYNSEIIPAYYSFLSETEKCNLHKSGITLWENEAQARSRMNEFKKALIKTNKNIIFIYSEKVNDEPASQHPLYSLLNSSIVDMGQFIFRPSISSPDHILTDYGYKTPPCTEAAIRIFSGKQSQFSIDNLHFAGLRKVESFSSLNKLINYPFDWIFEYCAHLKPGRIVEPDDIFTIMGNVAHKLVETIIKQAANDENQALSNLTTRYDILITTIAEAYGAILLLEQHELEYKLFKTRLRASAETLLINIIENNLKISSTEYKMMGSAGIIDGQILNSFIDLLLEDQEGSKIVVDLKWSRKDSKFRKSIKEGKAIQLALYSSLLQNNQSKVSKTAYYSLAEGRLISAFPFKGEQNIMVTNAPSESEVLQRIDNSVTYRMNQFKAGILEEGEEMLLTGLDYSLDQIAENLIPLDEKSKNKKKNWYSNFEILKGTFNNRI